MAPLPCRLHRVSLMGSPGTAQIQQPHALPAASAWAPAVHSVRCLQAASALTTPFVPWRRYWLVGLNPAASAFFKFVALIVVEALASQGLGVAVSAAVGSEKLAFAVAPGITIILLLFSEWRVWVLLMGVGFCGSCQSEEGRVLKAVGSAGKLAAQHCVLAPPAGPSAVVNEGALKELLACGSACVPRRRVPCEQEQHPGCHSVDHVRAQTLDWCRPAASCPMCAWPASGLQS